MSTPLILVAFVATVATCFAPERNCGLVAIGAIDAATSEILVNAYAFTMGPGIPEALIRAYDRGLDVRVIADRWTPCERQEGVEALAACLRDTTTGDLTARGDTSWEARNNGF